MKKILSAVLAVCMLASACFTLTACSGVSARTVEKDPVGTISEALGNALSAFFGDDAGAEKTLEKARKKGSLDITLASKDLMGGDLTEVNEIIYLDQKNNAFVSDTKVVYDGHRYKATVWGDKEDLIFKSASVLGSDDALKVNFDSFTKYFAESALFDYLHANLDVTDEDAADVVMLVEQLRGLMQGNVGTLTEKETKQLTKQIAEIFGQSVTTEQIKDENGKTVKNIVARYKVTNEKISEAYVLLEKAFIGEASVVEAIEPPYDIEADVYIYINAKTNAVSSVKVRADIVTPLNLITWGRDTIQTDLTLSFSEKQISLTGKVKVNNELYSVDAGIEKNESGNKVTYNAHASFKTGNVRIEVLELSCSYDKKTGELAVSGSVALDEQDSIDVSLTATYTANKNEVVFELGTVKVKDGEEILFAFTEDDELRIVIKPLDEIPAPDGDAVDVVTMDKDELDELFKGIGKSDVAALLMQILLGGLM